MSDETCWSCGRWDVPPAATTLLFECESCEVQFCSVCSTGPSDRRVLCDRCRSCAEESLAHRSAGAELNDLLAWPRFADDCRMRGALTDCECLPCSISERDRKWMIDELIERGLLKPFERPNWRDNYAPGHPRHLNRLQLIRRDEQAEKNSRERLAADKSERRRIAVRLWAQRQTELRHRLEERRAEAARLDLERQLVLL